MTLHPPAKSLRTGIPVDEDTAFRTILRTNLVYFIHQVFLTVSPGVEYRRNWHINAIAHHLSECHKGDCKRLIINQPPRSLKSISASVALPAFILGHDPTKRIIVVSYSNELAGELHRQFRLVVESDWYRKLFPKMRRKKDTGLQLVTTKGGGRLATSVGGTLTGRGADMIIIDDPVKADEAMSETTRKSVLDWYSGTLVSRLNDKEKGSLILVMQRLHEEDLAGYLLEAGGWAHLNLPAEAIEDEDISIGNGRVHNRKRGDLLQPERESAATLDHIKGQMGSLLYSAQYQQQPIPAEGNIVKRKWFKWADPAKDDPEVRGRIIQSWDVAMTTGDNNDFSVCTTWRVIKNDYTLINVWREKVEYPDLRRKVIALAKEYRPREILIEKAGPGLNLLQDLWDKNDIYPRPIGRVPKGAKVDRMVADSAKIEAGHVFLPRDAPWLDTYLNELLGFPKGKHDDQVDSTSQFLNWIAKNRSGSEGIAGGIIVPRTM